MELEVRCGGPDDLAAVAALHALSRRVTYRGIFPPAALRTITAAGLRRGWVDRLAREAATHTLFLAESGGGLVGFAYIGPGDEDEDVLPDTGVLHAMHVHPRAQGQGVGTVLMERCLRTFAEWRCCRAVLWVLEGNTRARRFYERGGWRHDGAVRDYAIGRSVTHRLRYCRPVVTQLGERVA